MLIKDRAITAIFNFYVNSSDFNGILLSKLAKQLKVEYFDLLSSISELVEDNAISLQNGENPHIVRWGHYDRETQIEIVKEAKNNKVEVTKMSKFGDNEFNMVTESHPVCVYPSPSYLQLNYKETKYDLLPFTKRLAYGEAQIKPIYFEIDVLDRYFNDPRYHFEFEDYSGQISVHETDLKETDKVFLQTFGLGYDEAGNRVAVVYLRYLSDFSSEHQNYWNSKQLSIPCRMVKEYYENTILGKWIFSQSLFSAVIEEHKIITEMSQLITGRPLFRQTYEGVKRPKEFTFFTLPTLANFESFVSLLDKMISDNINKDFFKDKIEEFELLPISNGIVERKPKGTLRLLNEWLKSNYHLEDESGHDILLAPFKEVRKERQKPAHKISENRYDKDFFKKQMDLLEKVYKSLTNLRAIFQKHPLASSAEIPEWIEKCEIKNF